MPRSIQGGRYRARATAPYVGILPTEIPIPSAQRNPVPDVQADGLAWYVCTCVPQAERRAAASLRRERDALAVRGLAPIEAYVPCLTDWVRRKRGATDLPRREVQTPLARSYVFIGARGGLKPGHLNVMSERDHEHRNRHGLIAILGRTWGSEASDEATCALPLTRTDIGVVAGWAARERADAEATDYRAYLAKRAGEAAAEASERVKGLPVFEAGDRVTVANGPFASFEAVVEAVDDVQARMIAEVSIFGRATPIELDFTDVRKAA